MGNSLSGLAIALLLGVSYVALKILKSFLVRSPLDNIPGPPAVNWMNGEQLWDSFSPSPDPMQLSGNFKQLLSRTGWDFYSHLTHDYGTVVKFHSMFGVGTIWYLSVILNTNLVDCRLVHSTSMTR